MKHPVPSDFPAATATSQLFGKERYLLDYLVGNPHTGGLGDPLTRVNAGINPDGTITTFPSAELQQTEHANINHSSGTGGWKIVHAHLQGE